MSTWTNIPAATFDTDRPVIGATHLAILNNITALAVGAAGAPRIQHAALGGNSVKTPNIAPSTITEEKYVTGSVSARAIGDNQIIREKLQASTVGDQERVAGFDASTDLTAFQKIFDVNVLRGGSFRLTYSHSSGNNTNAQVTTRVLVNLVVVSSVQSGSNAFVFRSVDLFGVPDGSIIQVDHARTGPVVAPVVTANVRLRNAGQVIWASPIFGVSRII